MSEFMTDGGQFSGFGVPISPETSMELYFHTGELQAARERQYGFVEEGTELPLSDLSSKPDVVADYIQAIYAIETFGNTVITRESIADLCALKEQTNAILTEFSPPHDSDITSIYNLVRESTAWAFDRVELIGQDMGYLELTRDVSQMLSPQKARDVNVMRFAARMWLDRFPAYQKEAAEQVSSIIFARLMRDEQKRIDAECDGTMISPCRVYEQRLRAINTMSDYAFAAWPMSQVEARIFLDPQSAF